MKRIPTTKNSGQQKNDSLILACFDSFGKCTSESYFNLQRLFDNSIRVKIGGHERRNGERHSNNRQNKRNAENEEKYARNSVAVSEGK